MFTDYLAEGLRPYSGCDTTHSFDCFLLQHTRSSPKLALPPFQTLLALPFPGSSDGVKESTIGFSSKETDDVSEKIQMGTT